MTTLHTSTSTALVATERTRHPMPDTNPNANATTPSAPPDLESAIQHMHDQVASLMDQLSRIDPRGLATARDDLNAALQAHKDAQATGTGDTQAGAQAGGGQPAGQGGAQAGAPDARSQAGQPPAGTRTSGPGPAVSTGTVSPENRRAGESSPPS